MEIIFGCWYIMEINNHVAYRSAGRLCWRFTLFHSRLQEEVYFVLFKYSIMRVFNFSTYTGEILIGNFLTST